MNGSINDDISLGLLGSDLSPLTGSCVFSDQRYDDLDGLTRKERILLRPWLENLIDSGRVPGLEWIDRDKYVFKVPWKHRSKKSWSVEHSSVFLEWAKNTGRWREGDPEPNYAQLKTRLRCAFNKAPDIQEIKELHKTKCEDAYKVYRFIPKKESRFGNFKKKMLIPTPAKRRHFTWMASSRYHGPQKRLKQEDAMETQLPQIKMEPLCGSQDEYCCEDVSSSYHGNGYGYEQESSMMDQNGRSSPQRCSSSDTVESLYALKYQKQQQQAERPLMFPNKSGNGQVQLQAFSDMAAELSRRGEGDTSDAYERLPCSDQGYHRNIEKHHFQSKFHDQVVTGGRHPYPQSSYTQVSQRDHLSEQQDCLSASRALISAEASDQVSERRLNVSYLEENRNATMRGMQMHQDSMKLQAQTGYGKLYPVGDGHMAQQMYHSSPQQRMEQEIQKFNQNMQGHEVVSSSCGYEEQPKRPTDFQPNQLLRCMETEPPPPEPRISQSLGMYLGRPDAQGLSGFMSGHPGDHYSRGPAQESLQPKSSNHVGLGGPNVTSLYQEDSDRMGKSLCSLAKGGRVFFSQGNNLDLKGKDCLDQMSLLAASSKPAGTNVLDLTKKVKMAVAPFIAHRAQPVKANDPDLCKVSPKLDLPLSQTERLGEHLNNLGTPNTKVLDLIEWERRLIERERELLARERLMTLKEKNLRELELAFHLNGKVDCLGQGSNPAGRADDSKVARSEKADCSVQSRTREQKGNCSSPPPLSPLRNFCDPRWPRGFYKGDASSSASSLSDDSELYYSRLFSRGGRPPRDVELVIDNAGEEFLGSVNRGFHTRPALLECVPSSEVLVITRNGGHLRAHSPEVTAAADEARRSQVPLVGSEKTLGSEEEFSKVLPVVDSLNSEEVLHIGKLSEKVSKEDEGQAVDNQESSCHFQSSRPEGESAAGKEETSSVHEEVWKRRMKWMSFQGLQNGASQVKNAGSHWIWPNIGNLKDRQQEQDKMEDGGGGGGN